MTPYVVQGAKYNYDIHIREPTTHWKFKGDFFVCLKNKSLTFHKEIQQLKMFF